jgi:hypothetical protein
MANQHHLYSTIIINHNIFYPSQKKYTAFQNWYFFALVYGILQKAVILNALRAILNALDE